MVGKSKTAAESRHLERIASMSCVLCDALGVPQTDPTTVHHIREGQGMAQRAPHYLTVPLCKSCHQGDLGVHGNQNLLRMAKMDEMGMLNETIRRLCE